MLHLGWFEDAALDPTMVRFEHLCVQTSCCAIEGRRWSVRYFRVHSKTTLPGRSEVLVHQREVVLPDVSCDLHVVEVSEAQGVGECFDLVSA